MVNTFVRAFILLVVDLVGSSPEVNISLSRNTPLYTGTTITLKCTATLHFNVGTDIEATTTWSGPRNVTGERYTISQSTSRGINIL